MAAFYKKRCLSEHVATPLWVIDEYDVNARTEKTNLIGENVFEVGDPSEIRVDKILKHLNLLGRRAGMND